MILTKKTNFYRSRQYNWRKRRYLKKSAILFVFRWSVIEYLLCSHIYCLLLKLSVSFMITTNRFNITKYSYFSNKFGLTSCRLGLRSLNEINYLYNDSGTRSFKEFQKSYWNTFYRYEILHMTSLHHFWRKRKEYRLSHDYVFEIWIVYLATMAAIHEKRTRRKRNGIEIGQNWYAYVTRKKASSVCVRLASVSRIFSLLVKDSI